LFPDFGIDFKEKRMVITDPIIVFSNLLFFGYFDWHRYQFIFLNPVNGDAQIDGIQAGFVVQSAPIVHDGRSGRAHEFPFLRFECW
jgi:hypothetical protein